MACKTIALLCFAAGISAIQAGVVPVAAAGPAVLAKIEDFDPAPQYSYAYDVQDSLTGDSKAAFETRNGDIVQGSYSLIEADGTRRIVDYTADPINGFNAVVNREPAVAAVAAGPVVTRAAFTAPVAAAAPVVARTAIAAPVAAASPVIARTAIAAPVAAAAPVLARTAIAAPAVAASSSQAVYTRTNVSPPLVAAAPAVFARTIAAPAVAAGPAPVFARTVAASAPIGAPVFARTVAAAAPVYQPYTIPRAVATRLGVPLTYANYVV